jgi:hypothetical protein
MGKHVSERTKEDWLNAKWRPMMGWMYMLTCVTDFVIFPILWSMLQASLKQPVTAWQPITLQGGGLFHLSMGAIVGVAAFGRTKEKLAGAHYDGFTPPVSSSWSPAFSTSATNGFDTTGSFNSPTTAPMSTDFNTTVGAPAYSSPTVMRGHGGKLAPVPEDDPVL